MIFEVVKMGILSIVGRKIAESVILGVRLVFNHMITVRFVKVVIDNRIHRYVDVRRVIMKSISKQIVSSVLLDVKAVYQVQKIVLNVKD